MSDSEKLIRLLREALETARGTSVVHTSCIRPSSDIPLRWSRDAEWGYLSVNEHGGCGGTLESFAERLEATARDVRAAILEKRESGPK